MARAVVSAVAEFRWRFLRACGSGTTCMWILEPRARHPEAESLWLEPGNLHFHQNARGSFCALTLEVTALKRSHIAPEDWPSMTGNPKRPCLPALPTCITSQAQVSALTCALTTAPSGLQAGSMEQKWGTRANSRAQGSQQLGSEFPRAKAKRQP